ncbi:hypothetical protein DY000_02059606 [Brassica cretica]|uniref:Reverse transcriptase zinc-binding domain-containing protein n=1 Tax=Brassica cretica TaxID=69181 RepID=A0ABQ7AV51_BRACR|nr:hypothetical protein DY000_02059606 [Brassica cretica]
MMCVTSGSNSSKKEQNEQLTVYQLSTVIGPAGPRVLRIMENAMVSDAISGSSWSSTTWEVLRPRQEKKDWVDVVWFKGAVPKHCFTMWVTNYDRLPTRSRLAGWGMLVSAECAFCSRFDETRDHLMLTCEYST